MKNLLKKKLVKVLSQRIIITIIVLLILAGVTINMVLGEEGILQRAENAREQQEKAQDMENIRLAMAEIKIDEMSKESPKHLKTILENTYGYENARVIESETGYTVVLNGRTYTVGKDGAVTYVNGATSTVPTTTSTPAATATPSQSETVNVTWEGNTYVVPKGITCQKFILEYAESAEWYTDKYYVDQYGNIALAARNGKSTVVFYSDTLDNISYDVSFKVDVKIEENAGFRGVFELTSLTPLDSFEGPFYN